MIKDYNYIGIGLSGKNDISKWGRNQTDILNKMCDMAYNENCKVHGLGYTSTKKLKNMKLYSVDSTSWKSGTQYGNLVKYDNIKKEMRYIKKPANSKLMLNSKKSAEINMKAWKQFAKDMEGTYEKNIVNFRWNGARK
jgi:hypothetical protein